MRIAHATDIHWFVPPKANELAFKRILGTANLYLRGRRKHFDRRVQQALVDHLRAVEPDAVMLTGDITSQALDAEFVVARQDLQPLLDEVPTFMIPGNHDVYTPGAVRTDAMGRVFGGWMGDRTRGVARMDVGEVTFLGLDPNRPTLVAASGRLPSTQLTRLTELLADPEVATRQIVLAIHYPLLDRRGNRYDSAAHGLINAQELIDVLDAAPTRPRLIACGHVHHGYRVELPLSDGTTIPLLNCGSSGYAHDTRRDRAAAMAVYQVEDGRPVTAERYLFDGEGFAEEPGGPWATGR